MMVANAFDLWQKDTFFSAAEEVQESADLMGSTYRAWVREMEHVETPEALSDLSRDLQTALGTAKWQLEEFERAVRLSQGPHGENVTSARHGQFIAAIRDQIANVEAALCQSLSKGDQPLRWVNLDKEERDDLTLFLSGTRSKGEFLPKVTAKKFFNRDGDRKEEANCYFGDPRVLVNDIKSLGDGKIDHTADCVLEKEGKDNLDRTVGVSRTWNSPSIGDWRIIVADEDGRDKLLPKVEVTPKVKGYKAPFWKARCGVHSPPKSLNGLFNKLFGRSHSLPRQSHIPRNLQPSRSMQLMLTLMLMIFLIGAVFNTEMRLKHRGKNSRRIKRLQPQGLICGLFYTRLQNGLPISRILPRRRDWCMLICNALFPLFRLIGGSDGVCTLLGIQFEND